MGKVSDKRRKFIIKLKQKRRKKIKKLKEKYLTTKTKEEKEKTLEKLRKIAPHCFFDEFLK